MRKILPFPVLVLCIAMQSAMVPADAKGHKRHANTNSPASESQTEAQPVPKAFPQAGPSGASIPDPFAQSVAMPKALEPARAKPRDTLLTSPIDMPDRPDTGEAPPNADRAFGAYQRGHYTTALREAMKRIDANPNDGVAMTLMGELYMQGLGVRRDAVEAARWYKLAADHGDRQGIFALASAKMRGAGMAEDRPGAKALFTKAAAMGHAGALYNLGIMAIEHNGVASDFATAAKDFEQAAQLGDAPAAYALGLLYRHGNGVEKDETRAAYWIRQAADNGNIEGQVEYAIMLFNGIGVDKDEAAAARYFLKAAVQNNAVAQNRLARLLVAGRGVAKNPVEAMKWHLLARTTGRKDPWLDAELNKLTKDQRKAVEAALHQYVSLSH